MATVNGLTKERMIEIENRCIIDGAVDLSGHLQLSQRDGTTIDAGNVVGPQGPQGPPGQDAPLPPDSGWFDVPPGDLLNGWKITIWGFQLRKIGVVAYIRGRLDGSTATSSWFYTLPEEFIPTALTQPPVWTSSGANYLVIYPTTHANRGNMTSPPGSTNTNFGHNWVAD